MTKLIVAVKLPLLGGSAVFKAALAQACHDLIANTDLLNELDSEVGDGDCGSTLANGARCMCHTANYVLNVDYFIVRFVYGPL